MKAKIWMPLYIGDYLRDTMHLSAEQHGMYLLLIMHYWTSGPIPDDDDQFSSITRCSLDTWKKNKPVIMKFFDASSIASSIQDDASSIAGALHNRCMWTHKRIDQEKQKAVENHKTREKVAKMAASKRWAMLEALPHAMHGACPSPSPSPSEGEYNNNNVELPLDVPPKVDEHQQRLITSARVIIAFLNETAGRHFGEAGAHLKPIMCRLKEVKGDVEGVKVMIKRQVKMWGSNPKMMEYLRPATLFAATNFHNYYDSRNNAIPSNGVTRRVVAAL